MSNTSLMNLKKEDDMRLVPLVPPTQGTDLVSHRGVDVSAADVRDLEKRMSPEDYITIMSALNDNTNVNRANVIRGMVGRSGTYSRSSNAGIASQLQRSSQLRDEDIQAAVLHKLRKAINSGDLPLGNMEAFNQWAVSLPHHFIKDVRSAYTSMSTQVRQERSSEIADLKLPYQLSALEFDESLQPGKKRIQELDIGKKEHDASMFGNERRLKELEIEQKELGIERDKIALEQGEIREVKDDKYITTYEWVRGDAFPGQVGSTGIGYWRFKSKSPRWEPKEGDVREIKKNDKIVTEIHKDGKWVEYSTADRWTPQTLPGDVVKVNHYIDLLRKSGETVTPAQEAAIFKDFGLTEQSVTRPAFTEAMIKQYNDKKTAFSNSVDTIKRMLEQLANPNVAVGNVQTLFTGIDNIGSQFRQFSAQFGDQHFLDPRQYEFETAELSGQLALNVTGLAYALAKQQEGNRLTDTDVQLRIDMITGRGGKKAMSKDQMTANLIEIFNNSVKEMANEHLNALDVKLPGTELYSTPQEFLDSRKAGELVIEPQIVDGKRTGVIGLGYYGSDEKFKLIMHWIQRPQATQ